MNEITGPMQTWAVGRQLIELPADGGPPSSGYAKVYYGGGADHTSVEIDILGHDITLAQFDEALSERARRIRAVQSSETGKSMLLGADELAPGKWLFQFHRSLGGTRSQTYELHLLVNGTHVKLAANSYEGSNAQVESRLLELAPQVVAVKQAEAAGPGISLGPVIIRGTHDHEMGIVSFMARGSNVKLRHHASSRQAPSVVQPPRKPKPTGKPWTPLSQANPAQRNSGAESTGPYAASCVVSRLISSWRRSISWRSSRRRRAASKRCRSSRLRGASGGTAVGAPLSSTATIVK